jgi:hypothetical protein
MTALSVQEQKLKDLIEDRGVGIQEQSLKARLTKTLMEKDYGGLTYDEAMRLAEENDDILQFTPAHDPAFMYLVTTRNNMLKWAEVMNDVSIMGRYDHMLPVHALVSVDNVTVECKFHIPKLYYNERERKTIIESQLRQKLHRSSDWAASVRRPPTIDFVEL